MLYDLFIPPTSILAWKIREKLMPKQEYIPDCLILKRHSIAVLIERLKNLSISFYLLVMRIKHIIPAKLNKNYYSNAF